MWLWYLTSGLVCINMRVWVGVARDVMKVKDEPVYSGDSIFYGVIEVRARRGGGGGPQKEEEGEEGGGGNFPLSRRGRFLPTATRLLYGDSSERA